jgi:hypothetical protein
MDNRNNPNLILGFHGCDANDCQKLINSQNEFKISQKKYDWLGNGMYFWENNYKRALEWAKAKQNRGEIKKAAVVGAVLQLNHCCDFLNSESIQTLKDYYGLMKAHYKKANWPLPINKDVTSDLNKDKLLRHLDCAVIEFMNDSIQSRVKLEIEKNGYSNFNVFDSVRGVFVEGGRIYDGAGIFEKSHIQICIRNPNCIKGFFLPRKEIDFLKYLKVVS